MKVIVVPLLGAPAINPAYHYLAGNRAALPGMVFTMIVAGFAEETLFRGFLFERLGKLFGTGAAQEYPSSYSPPRCLPWAITPIKGFLASNRR